MNSHPICGTIGCTLCREPVYGVPTGVVPSLDTSEGESRIAPPGSIGDINSTAKGSGARFNAGKAPLDLIPLRIIADTYGYAGSSGPAYALRDLGLWQETGDHAYLELALEALGLDGWMECAQVFDYGKRKYAEWNWAKGMDWTIPMACAARHLMRMLDGEDNDVESGLPHRGHVFCNIVMLLTFIRTYPEGDNRPRCLA